MTRLLANPLTYLAFSTLVATMTGIAVIGLGAPLKVFVPVTYATAAIAAPLSYWARHRPNRR